MVIWLLIIWGLTILGLGVIELRLRRLERIVAQVDQAVVAIVQRFHDAGIDVTVTQPMQTHVTMPERWLDELPDEAMIGNGDTPGE